MEIFDIVDENGNPTGSTVERKTAHSDGIRHRTAHIWIARKEKITGRWSVLLQKRALTKDSFPGKYDTSSAGHIQAGDEPLESALRELHEELGIAANAADLLPIGTFEIRFEKEFHGSVFKDNEVAFVFLYTKKIDISDITVQKEELDSVAWFDLEDTYEKLKEHDERFCVPIAGLELLRKYLKTL